MSHLCCCTKGFDGRFELHKQYIGLRNGRLGVSDIFGCEQTVGTTCYDNGVFAIGIDSDNSNAGSSLVGRRDVLRVYSILLELLNHLTSIVVVPHFANEGDIATKQGCGNGLVGTFASEVGHKLLAHYRLTR